MYNDFRMRVGGYMLCTNRPYLYRKEAVSKVNFLSSNVVKYLLIQPVAVIQKASPFIGDDGFGLLRQPLFSSAI